MKIRVLGSVVVFLFLSVNVFAANVIFNDTNLLSAVQTQYEAQVGVPLSDPPQDTELSDPAFQGLDASYLGITDLTGLEACTSLTVLNLTGNEITDLSPISGLTSLEYLMLGKNQLTDITALGSLTGLQLLDIGFNQISDISILSSLTNLVGLNLGFGTLELYDDFDPFATGTNALDDTDLAVLNSLTSLQILSIGGLDSVTSLSFLSNLTNLTQLWMGSNPISDWTPLGDVASNLNAFVEASCGLGQTELETYVADMTSIQYVDESNVGILGILSESGITDLSSLDQLNPSIAFLGVLGITDIDVAQNWTNLNFFVCSDTGITNINGLIGLQNLTFAILNNNDIGPAMFTEEVTTPFDSLGGISLDENVLENISGIEYMPGLIAFTAANNQISDIMSLSGSPNTGTLESLILSYNQIEEINPLKDCIALKNVFLDNNQIQNFGFLLDNEGIGNGDYIDVSNNPVPPDLCYLVDQLVAKVQPDGGVNRSGVCELSLTVEIEGVGNVSPPVGTNTINRGSQVYIWAYPQVNSGQAFDHWEIWNEVSSSYEFLTDITNYSFDNVQENMKIKAVFVAGDHSLTFSFDPSSTGTGSVLPFSDGSGVYSYKTGQMANLYAEPDEGSCFAWWTGDAASFGSSTYANIYMDSDKTVGVVFSNQCYALTIESVGNGSVSPPAGTYQCANGAVKQIYAFAGSGYYFDHWENGEGNNLGSGSPLEVTITQDITIRAIFTEILTYDLTINVVGSGTTNPAPGTRVYTPDAVVSVYAIPDIGSLFDGWEGDIGSANTMDNPIQIVMNSDKTLTARFRPADYTVSIATDGPGTTDPAPGTYYLIAGQWMFLNAIPQTEKAFLGWYDENDELVFEFPEYGFEVTSDRNLIAKFGDPDYLVNLIISGNGTTDPAPGTYGYIEGQWAVFYASPDLGYALLHWEIDNGTTVSYVEGPTLAIQVQSDLDITAVFSICDWNVNITTAGTGSGSLDPAPGAYCFITGQELDLSAQPATGDYFGGLEIIKNPLSTHKTTWVYWFETVLTVEAHYDIVAHFEDTGWMLNFAIEGDGGVLASNGETSVIAGSYALTNNFQLKLTAVPSFGQAFKGWYSNDTLLSTNSVYETTINSDLQLTAKFAPIVWRKLVLTVDEGQGTTSPTPNVEYQYLDGAIANAQAIPADGWMFDAWTGDIEGIDGLDQPLINIPMNRDRNIGVIFVQIPPEGEGTPEGTVEGTPEGTVEGTPEGTVEGTPEGTVEGTPEGTVEGEIGPHSADQNGDGIISLSELLRVIQFFNMGGYHCDPSNEEDGYNGGYDGDHTCTPHSSDYYPQNWMIELGELLRLIQFFNMGGYHPCPGEEDGYCAGPQL